MPGQNTFEAQLVHPAEPGRDRSLSLPLLESIPPSRVRVPTLFAGTAAMDEYELVSADDWPGRATFRYTGTVPQTTD
jgi:hypothetical protein